MQKSLASLFLLASALAAQAGTVTIKNNTHANQSVGLFQDHKLIGYVDRLKPGKTLAIKFDDHGAKPVISFNYLGERQYVLLPLKTAPYTFTRLFGWAKK